MSPVAMACYSAGLCRGATKRLEFRIITATRGVTVHVAIGSEKL